LTVIFRKNHNEVVLGLVDADEEIYNFTKFNDEEKAFADLTFNQLMIVSVNTEDDGFKVSPLTQTTVEESNNKNFTISAIDKEELIGLCNSVLNHYRETQLDD